MESIQHKNLASALLGVQSEITMLQKDATNDHHGFNYASADGIVSQTKPFFIKHGVQVRHGGRKVEALPDMTETKRAKNGGGEYTVTVQRAMVTLTTTVTHAESGDTFEESNSLIAESSNGRPIDKAILGAETTIIGYALRGILNLPRFDNEGQVCGRDDTAYNPNAIGQDAAQALVTEMNRVGVSVQFVKRKLVEGGADADSLKGPVAAWPKTHIARIQEGLDKARAAQTSQRAQIQSLPQRRDDGLIVDPSTSQIEPEPPEPTPSRSNGNSKSKPASSKTAPASFGNEMAKLIP